MLLRLLLLASMFAIDWTGSAFADDSEWQFEDWDGPTFTVRMFIPDGVAPSTPIVVVMHGWSREAGRYFNDWRSLGAEHGFIVIVPEFNAKDFPESNHYNLGHVFDGQSAKQRPQSLWTFSAIEYLFDEIITRTGSAQTEYTLYGHSAGSQFVHRFLYYMPEARVRRYIAANAGWYTMPEFDTGYPYGLADAAIDADQLKAAMQKDVVLLLGREDLDHTDPDLRNTPEARRQGKNRLARGLKMFSVAKNSAGKLGIDLKWRLAIVDEAGHVNAEMAPAAAQLVE
jgi:hypothetical protein